MNKRYHVHLSMVIDMDKDEAIDPLARLNEQDGEIKDLRSKLLRAVEEGCEWKRKYEEAEAMNRKLANRLSGRRG